MSVNQFTYPNRPDIVSLNVKTGAVQQVAGSTPSPFATDGSILTAFFKG